MVITILTSESFNLVILTFIGLFSENNEIITLVILYSFWAKVYNFDAMNVVLKLM